MQVNIQWIQRLLIYLQNHHIMTFKRSSEQIQINIASEWSVVHEPRIKGWQLHAFIP